MQGEGVCLKSGKTNSLCYITHVVTTDPNFTYHHHHPHHNRLLLTHSILHARHFTHLLNRQENGHFYQFAGGEIEAWRDYITGSVESTL